MQPGKEEVGSTSRSLIWFDLIAVTGSVCHQGFRCGEFASKMKAMLKEQHLIISVELLRLVHILTRKLLANYFENHLKVICYAKMAENAVLF